MLDQKTGPLKRHPLRLEDYEWEQAQPENISPVLKRAEVITSGLIRGTYPPPIRALLTLADRIHNPGLNRLIGQYATNQVLPKAKTT